MLIPLDPTLILSLLEEHTPCFDKEAKIFPEASCPKCGSPTYAQVSSTKPFIGAKINYTLICTQCQSKIHPGTMSIID